MFGSGLDLTDTALEELKIQSPEGCFLCVFGALDDDEWD